MKQCTKCKAIKPIDCFPKRKTEDDGLDGWCKSCHAINAKSFQSSEHGKEYCNNNSIKWAKNNPEKILFMAARRRAKLQNIPFNIELTDIIIPEFCPIFGFKLGHGSNRVPADSSISIDKIDNTLGYTKNNIIIVSWLANKLKSVSSHNELKVMYEKFNLIPIIDDELDVPLSYKKGIITKARKRAKRKGLIFNLELSDIKISKLCPILNIPLEIQKIIHSDNSPSLDRVDNLLGYEKGNIRIISFWANTIKNNASYSNFEKIFKFYDKIMK